MVSQIDIPSIPAVPPDASLAYHRAIGTLTEEVNQAMERRADLSALIGTGGLTLMRDNHRNHAAFMDNVFFLGNHSLLARVVPWVYRVYSARGFSPDYFPAELQAWSRAVQNRISHPLSEPILGVYAWMIRHHDRFIELSQDLDPARPELQLPALDLNRLVEAFLKGDFTAATRLVEAALGDQPDLETFYLWVLDPVMREIGRRWELDQVSSAQEHVASALATRMMSVAYAKFDMMPDLGKRAVVCTGPGEQHQIGAWMVSDLLELRGWDARLVGANPSVEGLLSLLEDFRPAVLAVSVTMPFHLQEAAQLITTLRAHPQLQVLKVMVGGPAFALDPTLPAALGADGHAPDARSAALLAEGWWKELQG